MREEQGLPMILVVDDDGDLRSAARALLEDEGYAVEDAPNGAVALARLWAGFRPSVILLDLMMPLVSGQKVLDVVQSTPELASLPIVVMTAAVVDPATSCLPYPLLRKPFDVTALLSAISAYAPRLWDDNEPTTPPMEDEPDTYPTTAAPSAPARPLHE